MTAEKPIPERVVFYQLSRKFVHRSHDVPANSKQLIHYTLAIGHHIGIIDCFSPKLEVPYDGYGRWVARLPKGEARRKLEGLSRFGEIEIAVPHAELLQDALRASLPEMAPEEAEWTGRLTEILQTIVEEPALYLMVRRR